MKKYYLLSVLLLAGATGAFAVEDMRFVTTLSAPLAVFDKVETSMVNQPATATKATIGVLTRSDKSFNTTVTLSTKKAHLRTLELSNNTNLKSTTVPQWKTNKIAVKNSGSLTGKQLKSNNFTFTNANTSETASVHTLGANNITVTDSSKSLTLASATATNELKIANKAWYQTVNSVPVAGNAVWETFSNAGSEGNKTFTNVLHYHGRGPSSGASSGKWNLTQTRVSTSCVYGTSGVLTDSCQAVAGRSGSSVANTSCTSCGASCVYTPCMSGNYYQENTYTCVC